MLCTGSGGLGKDFQGGEDEFAQERIRSEHPEHPSEFHTSEDICDPRVVLAIIQGPE